MSLFGELKRRNVIRVGTAYVAVSWLAIQVLDVLLPMFGASDGAARLVVIVLAIGLLPALIGAWVFEWTSDGIKRDDDVDHSTSSSKSAAQRLDRAIIVILAVAVAFFAFDKFVLDPQRDDEIAKQAAEAARDEALLGQFGERSIVVLPFADVSENNDQGYFSDGIADEIINLLSTVPNLRVISRSSAFALKGRELPIAEIADLLDVRFVMEGSVRRFGDRLRVTAQLIDAGTDTQLWSENFDRDFGDVFAIQDEIAATVVNKLEMDLGAAMPKSRPVDPEAYGLYLQAVQGVNMQTWAQSQNAEKLLEESLAIDDQHVAAWLLYWKINGQKVAFSDMTWPEWALETRHAVEKALEIDPNHPKARAYLARLSYTAMATFEGETQAAAYGMMLDPLDTEINANAGRVLVSVGMAERAIPYYEYGAQRDPLSARYWRGLMNANLYAGRWQAGLEANKRLREIVGGAGGLWNKGMLHLLLGELEESKLAFEAWADASPKHPHAYHGTVLISDALGMTSERDAAMAELEQHDSGVEILASAYAWLGRTDDALEIIDASIRPPRGFGPIPMHENPLLPGLSDDPRWEELVTRQGTSEEQVAEWEIDKLFPGAGLPPTLSVSPP